MKTCYFCKKVMTDPLEPTEILFADGPADMCDHCYHNLCELEAEIGPL